MGAVTGALVGDALANGHSTWTESSSASIGHAEAWLAGGVVPLDLAPQQAVPVAVGLAATAAPLLIDPAAVEMIDHIAAWLNREEATPFDGPVLAQAAAAAQDYDGDFVDAVTAAPPQSAALTGALIGLYGGIGAIPARLVAELRCPEDQRRRRYLYGSATGSSTCIASTGTTLAIGEVQSRCFPGSG